MLTNASVHHIFYQIHDNRKFAKRAFYRLLGSEQLQINYDACDWHIFTLSKRIIA
jgi:hypothetical protein